jgi:hypothetical protein
MGRRRPERELHAAGTAVISRTRRAQLVAEFEGDLGIDHKARARAARDAIRWRRIKTFIVWTIAIMFFAIACQKLWVMGQRVDDPFSAVDPGIERLEHMLDE